MSAQGRPDPDELLERLREDERLAARGKLKIFFGAAPGVGKTYAMLMAARDAASEGMEVVVGILEHHGRKETAELLLGLAILPRRKVVYRGASLEELDLDAALARHPKLLLVDELAHTNAEGSRTNLLEVTKLESGHLDLRRDWQPVEEVLGAALNRLDDPLRGRAVTTRVGDGMPMIAMDGVLVEQVFMNLLENALKYTPAGTAIDIDVEREGDAVLVSVRDHGPGVAPGEERRLFDKFYRAGGEAKSVETSAGSGLGLTISRGIVKAHGGRLWVENAPDGGAVFRFTLPIGGTPPRAPMELAADDEVLA